MSIKRKLQALGYVNSEINLEDQRQIRQVYKWLEETVLQQLNGDEKITLCNVDLKDWDQAFEKYIKRLNCPLSSDKKLQVLDWCLGYAIKLEYAKNKSNYNKYGVDALKTSNVPNVVADNPLDNLDYSSKEFKEGVNNLANILKVPPHLDPLITLEACSKLVQRRLNSAALQNPTEVIVKGTPFPFKDTDLGFDLKDPTLNEAAKLMRLLYIHDLRKLQTGANECIVAVQNLTQNPKTDTKIGVVGR